DVRVAALGVVGHRQRDGVHPTSRVSARWGARPLGHGPSGSRHRAWRHREARIVPPIGSSLAFFPGPAPAAPPRPAAPLRGAAYVSAAEYVAPSGVRDGRHRAPRRTGTGLGRTRAPTVAALCIGTGTGFAVPTAN